MRPIAAHLLIFGLSAAAGFGQSPAAPNAVRLTKYIFGVADLDKTYAFYHALGFELENGKDTLNKPSVLPEPLLKLVDVPAGTKFRNMMLKVPGADFALEVTEFSNLELHPVHPRSQDPGASTFLLTVRDVDAALAIATKAGGEGSRTNGPIQMVKDPDGYYVELLKPANPAPAGTAPANSIVTAAGFGFIVEDADAAGRFYHDHLGFKVETSAYPNHAQCADPHRPCHHSRDQPRYKRDLALHRTQEWRPQIVSTPHSRSGRRRRRPPGSRSRCGRGSRQSRGRLGDHARGQCGTGRGQGRLRARSQRYFGGAKPTGSAKIAAHPS